MTDSPESDLEAALLRARDDAAARPDFYRLLMQSKLLALGELGHGTDEGRLTLAVAQRNGQPLHPIFSSQARLIGFDASGLPHVVVPARELFEATRGSHFVLDPGSEFAKELAPEEIAYWLKETGVPDTARRLPIARVKAPDPYPSTLVKALSILFINRQVRAAHLLQAEFVGAGPRLLIGVESDDDWRKLAMEIAITVEAAKPAMQVDLLRIEPDKPKAPVIEELLKVSPFYQRSIFNA